MPAFGWANCPAAVRAQADGLLAGFQATLADNLVGVYLHGSLATGCFNPLRSDVDLLAVTREPMAVAVKRRLAKLLLTRSRQPSPVEISFLVRADLTPWRHPAPYDFHYSEDWRTTFGRDLESGAWREWNAVPRRDPDLAGHITVTHHRGVCLYGPPIAEVFPPVPRADFLASILGDVLDAQFGLNSDLSHPTYVILNACRTYAYLRTGQVLSKDEGGVWALDALPMRFRPTVTAALDAYRDRGDERGLEQEAVAALAAYLRAAITAYG